GERGNGSGGAGLPAGEGPGRTAEDRLLAARRYVLDPGGAGAAAVSRLGGDAEVPRPARRQLRRVARRRTLAPQLLPDLRLRPGHGTAGREGPRPQAPPLLRAVRDALAVQAGPVSLLRARLGSCAGPEHRGRGRAPHRPVRGLPGISQDLRWTGRRGA